MKTVKLICLLFVLSSHAVMGQNDYIVKTSPSKSTASRPEERFVDDNFQFHSLCSWSPGLKFMYLLEEKYSFIPTFYSYETEESVDNKFFNQKIATFEGIEESEKMDGRRSLSTRFIFEIDGKKYYHEFKNQRLNEICMKTPRAHIKGLVYLGDIDKGRELLAGRTLYVQTTLLRVDDPNSANGYREVGVPMNQRLRVTAVGLGSREFPVKIIMEDNTGRSYYAELAFSTTNSGLVKSDFQGEQRMKYFPNVFTFDDHHERTINEIKGSYSGKYIYPVKNLDSKLNGSSVVLFRYTPLQVVDMEVSSDKISATLQLKDKNDNIYTVPTKLKYDVVLKNEDYFYDVFSEGNIRAEYPYITDENWSLIVNGNIKLGMTKDECRLSLGSPVQIVANLNSRYESWFYYGKTLEFEDGKLIRIK